MSMAIHVICESPECRYARRQFNAYCDDDSAPFGLAFYLWPAAEFSVPLGVFSRRAGAVGEHVLAALNAVGSMRSWEGALRQLELIRVGEQLSTAQWVPQVPADAHVPLRELLRARALRPSDVEARTGIRAADLTAMIQGWREATDSEAAQLAELLDVSPSVVKRPVALPPALVRAIERPVHRAALRLRALRNQTSEALARLAVARSVLAMPARTAVAERDVETWDQLVRQYLDG